LIVTFFQEFVFNIEEAPNERKRQKEIQAKPGFSFLLSVAFVTY
jgi:hypothetical protein